MSTLCGRAYYLRDAIVEWDSFSYLVFFASLTEMCGNQHFWPGRSLWLWSWTCFFFWLVAQVRCATRRALCILYSWVQNPKQQKVVVFVSTHYYWPSTWYWLISFAIMQILFVFFWHQAIFFCRTPFFVGKNGEGHCYPIGNVLDIMKSAGQSLRDRTGQMNASGFDVPQDIWRQHLNKFIAYWIERLIDSHKSINLGGLDIIHHFTTFSMP